MVQSFGRNFLRCALAAEGVDHPGGHVVDRDIGRGRGAALRQFLEDDGGVEPRQRRAADIVLHVDAAEAERRGLPQLGDREDLALVPGARIRRHLVAGELPRGRLEGALVLGEFEIHAPTDRKRPFPRQRRRRWQSVPRTAKNSHRWRASWPSNTVARSNPASASSRPKRKAGRRPQALDLTTRPRRNRRTEWARRMVRENVLTTDDLIWPMFVAEGNARAGRVDARRRAPVDRRDRARRGTRGQAHHSVHRAVSLHRSGICATRTAARRSMPQNLVCRAVRAVKKAVPEVGVLCDVALDPYTSHGHDGLMRDGTILNDETVAVLVQQALVQAEAGCDIIAPSDMMDGRVGAIRAGLDAAGFQRRADHGLYGEIRLGLLRAVPRRGRLVGDADRRQAHLPDGSRQHRRGAARGRARHRRGRRHDHGQARPALSRYSAAREGQRSACRPSPIRCRANTRW